MKLLTLAVTGLSCLGALAAKSKTTDQFKKFHVKSRTTNGPVSLDDASFKQFTATPRNHTAAVLLTALETRFGCEMCQKFQPDWIILAKSWLRGDKEGSSRLLFGTLDFIDGRQTFQSVCGRWRSRGRPCIELDVCVAWPTNSTNTATVSSDRGTEC